MAVWRLTEFAGITLPRYNTEVDFTGGRAASPLQRTINGVHDPYGDQRVIPLPPPILSSGIYASDSILAPAELWVTEAGDTMVTEDGDNLVFEYEIATGAETPAREQLQALRALIGKVGLLVRVATDDDTVVQKIRARLLEARHVTRRNWHGRLAQVDCRFEAVDDPYWYVDDVLSATGLTLNFTIGGNAPVLDAVLDITGAIASSCTIVGDGHQLTWTGSLSGGQHLIISGMSVTANGVDSAVTWGANHEYERLLHLEPGSHTITITGAAGATLTWYDKWQ